MDRQGRMYKCKSGVWVLLWVRTPGTGIRRPVATGVFHANLVVNHPGGATVYPIHTGTTNAAMEGHTTGDAGSASEEECQGEHLDGLATDIRNAEAAGGYDLTIQVDQFKSELSSALDAGCFIMD